MSGDYRKFGCLSDACSNFPCQLGALVPESFSELMSSAANLLFDAHSIRLFGHDNVDKVIAVRMNEMIMERVRREEALTSIVFQDILLDEHVSTNEEWKY